MVAQADEQTIALPFRMAVPLLKAEEESHHGEVIRFVSGMASLEIPDRQGETMIQKGIDFGPLLETGYINWDHGDVRWKSPEYLIGEPTHAAIIKHQGVDGLYIEGRLWKGHPMADHAWDFLMATSKSAGNRRGGWSVQGHTLASHRGQLLRSVVRDMALTHKPVLAETTVDFREIAKSLDEAGYLTGAMLAKAMTIATAQPLMTEDLIGADGSGRRHMKGKSLEALVESIYGPGSLCKSAHYDDRGRFTGGSTGMIDHLTRCLGQDPEEATHIARVLRGVFPE